MTAKTVLVTVDGKEHAYPLFVCERCGASVRVTDKRSELRRVT